MAVRQYWPAAVHAEAQRESLAGAALLALVVILCGLFAQRTRAQGRGGALAVTVSTEPGATAPPIRVQVRGPADAESTGASGSPIIFRNLPPGKYRVTASAAGFTGAHATVTVRGAKENTAVLVLHRSPAAAANPGEGTAGSSERMSEGTMSSLPLNGRSTSSLVGLEPGVITAKTQSHGQGRMGFGDQMEVYGSRPRQNNSRLDGISVNDYANGPRGNATGISLGVDALSQITVLTTYDQARYGRSSGGEISATTRSGTSKFHGSAAFYLRNSALDTRNYFDVTKPPFRRSQFAVSAGGPLGKNTFVFGDYEGIRQSQGYTQLATVPSRDARVGNLSTGQITVDPAVKRYVDAFYPLPNGSLLGDGDTGLYVFPGQKITPGNHFTARVDHDFSTHDTLDGVYMYDVGSVTQPSFLNAILEEYNSSENFFTANYQHTFSPRASNQLRLGVNHVASQSGITHPGANPAAGDTSYGIVAGEDAPRIDVASLAPFTGGLNAANTFNFHWTSIQAYDDFSVQKGTHALQFGGAFERMRDNIVADVEPGGRYTFNSLSDFLENRPFSLVVTLSGASRKGFRQTRLAAYAQDDWQMSPRFALHLGLRYEMATIPTEVYGELSTLRSLTSPQLHLGNPLFSNPTLHDFAPRVGFSWAPFRRRSTVVDSSFGIFDVLPLPYEIQFNELFTAPSYQGRSLTNLPQGSFPEGAYQLAAASSAASVAYFQPHPRRNYVMRWNLDVEHQFSPSLGIKIGYVGSHGVHQILRVHDANIVLPTLTPEGYLWPSPVGSGTRINPSLGRIEAALWTGDSSYNALVLQVNRRLNAGFQLEGSYTWGKSIDTSSGSISGDEYVNSISSPLWFAPRLNRGLSDFNIAQDLKVLGSWDLPQPAGSADVAWWALRGWQLSGIFETSTGVPFTPGIAGDPLGVNSTDPTLDVPNVLSGPGCGSLVNPRDPLHYIKTDCYSVPDPITLRGDAGRNTLIGPGYVNVDASLSKSNHIRRISPAFDVQFRAECFNLMNHANFNAPLHDRFIFDAQGNPLGNAGLIGRTEGPSREIQFALRVMW